MTSRHPLVTGLARLLPVGIGVGAAVGTFGQLIPVRVAGFAFSGLFAMVWAAQRRWQPVLLLDDDGYAVEQLEREKLRVRWSEVQKVRVERREHACYVDCGDKERNLFVPPRRGYGFYFADSPGIVDCVLKKVPAERVVEVERIDVS